MSDLFEAILNPLMKAAMGDDTKSGILAPGYFGPYAGGFWPYQYGLMESRADALGIGAIKASMKGPSSGGEPAAQRPLLRAVRPADRRFDVEGDLERHDEVLRQAVGGAARNSGAILRAILRAIL